MTASEEQHAAAVIAALNGLGAAAYDFDDIPAALPQFYTEVTVSRRYGGEVRGVTTTTTLMRITTRAVARRLSNAREMRRRAAGLEGLTLTINGEQSTPIQFETEDLIAPDEAWYSGITYWTYAL